MPESPVTRTPRHDVSGVPTQGGYVAKKCPVVIQNDILLPAERIPTPPDVAMRMDDGNRFEDVVIDELRSVGQPDWVFVDESLRREEAIDLTVEAMEERAPVITGGWLPEDDVGRRKGKPDLLVLAAGGYVPLDIKNHLTLSEDPDASHETSTLAAPQPGARVSTEGQALRKNQGDVLQLAHYRRMLQAAGHASQTTLAGIIGKERLVVWYDLDLELWQTPAKSDGKKRKMRSSLERYDFEFSFRLDIAAKAIEHQVNPAVEPIVVPVRHGDCPTCPWHDYCYGILERGSGDPSLLPSIGWSQWKVFNDAGIANRQQVADLDYPTADLISAGVDVVKLFEATRGAGSATSVQQLIPRAKKQIEVLEGAGVLSVADVVARIDQRTVDVGAGSWLSRAILNARAWVGASSVYQRPEGGVSVPRADIEVDVDMESVNEGVYLWGVLVTDRAGSGIEESGYRAFSSFEPMSEEVERAVLLSFWEWFTGLRERTRQAGLSFCAYNWHGSAETAPMKRITRSDPGWRSHIDEFVASDDWVDLKDVFESGWITGTGVGLKDIAPLAGYEWSVDDPGGGLAMVKYQEAVAELEHGGTEAATWLLDYNQGDVEATAKIRNWLEAEGSTWPKVSVQ